VDGILLECRRCVSVLLSKGARPTIRATGPVVSSRWFRQRLADATGCDVVARADASSAAAIGAAALLDPALGEALTQRAAGGAPIARPRPETADEWRDRWNRHEAARRAIGSSVRANG